MEHEPSAAGILSRELDRSDVTVDISCCQRSQTYSMLQLPLCLPACNPNVPPMPGDGHGERRAAAGLSSRIGPFIAPNASKASNPLTTRFYA